MYFVSSTEITSKLHQIILDKVCNYLKKLNPRKTTTKECKYNFLKSCYKRKCTSCSFHEKINKDKGKIKAKSSFDLFVCNKS